MLQKYYTATGKIVLFDTFNNRITSEDCAKTFGKVTPSQVELLIRSGSLSPAEESRRIKV